MGSSSPQEVAVGRQAFAFFFTLGRSGLMLGSPGAGDDCGSMLGSLCAAGDGESMLGSLCAGGDGGPMLVAGLDL